MQRGEKRLHQAQIKQTIEPYEQGVHKRRELLADVLSDLRGGLQSFITYGILSLHKRALLIDLFLFQFKSSSEGSFLRVHPFTL
jgi:hypothetical protein